MAMTSPVRLSDFLQYAESDERRLELLDGVIIESFGRTWHEGEVVLSFAMLLSKQGESSVSARAVIESAEASLVPAVPFFREDPGIDDSYVFQPPHVVVDVRDSNRTEEQFNRMADVLVSFGVESVWLVDPDREEMRIIEAGNELKLGRDDRLTSAAVPGLDVPLARLFRPEQRTTPDEQRP